jgi:hypothetical protein
MKPEDLVEVALKAAKKRGVKIVRGPVFNWCSPLNNETPLACNAIGALLLHFGLQNLVRDGFKTGWAGILCNTSGLTYPWILRFSHGWNHGNCLLITYIDNGKEKTSQDETSKNANKMASRWVR